MTSSVMRCLQHRLDLHAAELKRSRSVFLGLQARLHNLRATYTEQLRDVRTRKAFALFVDAKVCAADQRVS